MGRARARQRAEGRNRDLRRELKDLEQQDPGPERASSFAALTRAANDDRQLNLAMHAASRCLEEDPHAPQLLLAAYEDGPGSAEDRLDALADLRDLARYVERPDLAAAAHERLVEGARTWVAGADPGERRYRLRTVQSLTSREVADGLRAELGAGPTAG